MVTKEFKGLVKGEYGNTPVAIDPDFREKIIGDEQPITCRPADLLEPELEKAARRVCKVVRAGGGCAVIRTVPEGCSRFL